MRLKQMMLLGFLVGGGLATVGCGGDQIKHQGGTDNAPQWVNQGAAAFKDKAFYGVGVASGISSISLRRSTADAQARAELARVFTSKVQNLLKNYEASTGDGDKEAAEAHRQEATKVFTEMELTGVEIIDRYYDLEQASQYALARLEPEAFEGQLDRLDRLSTRAKEVIRENARKAFQELDAESAKRAAQAAE
ncbi:MAG: LPP20 family lipoprotein [Myxococcales bacterium]|nr:LPP20 family lipoprotein [Myxococcales bacterium]MCB9547993.1 LPP20 family lipoprotein [Myxococcales bacterium]